MTIRRLRNVLRVIKLTSLKDEYAYLLTEDYTGLVARMRALQEVCSVTIRALNAQIAFLRMYAVLGHTVMLLDPWFPTWEAQ